MATTYEIVQGIQQAVANAYDGAENLIPDVTKLDLKRSKGDPILDSRQGEMDGFGIKINKNVLMITYHTECTVRYIHRMGGVEKYQNETEQQMANIVKYLKGEYKRLVGSNLRLTQVGEVDTLIQPVSKLRTSVQAYGFYRIGGIPAGEEQGQVKTTPERMKSLYTSLKEEKVEKTLKFKPFWR